MFFEEAAAGGLDVITTGGWRFDLPDESAIIGAYARPFLDCGGRVCFVELAARLETGLERNLTENRRRHKNTDWSMPEALRRDDAADRHDSGGAIPLDVPFLRIETDTLTADQTARRIAAHFGLPW